MLATASIDDGRPASRRARTAARRSRIGQDRRVSKGDEEWAAVYEVVMRGLKDWAVPDHLPTTAEEVGFLAETVTDHVVAAFRTERRH